MKTTTRQTPYNLHPSCGVLSLGRVAPCLQLWGWPQHHHERGPRTQGHKWWDHRWPFPRNRVPRRWANLWANLRTISCASFCTPHCPRHLPFRGPLIATLLQSSYILLPCTASCCISLYCRQKVKTTKLVLSSSFIKSYMSGSWNADPYSPLLWNKTMIAPRSSWNMSYLLAE